MKRVLIWAVGVAAVIALKGTGGTGGNGQRRCWPQWLDVFFAKSGLDQCRRHRVVDLEIVISQRHGERW
jgi:hypothetical protein